MATWWQPTLDDLSCLPDLGEGLRITVRMLLAATLGGLLGYERQRHGKQAGLRTHMLVALGSAFFVLVPEQAGMSQNALSRVIQGVITGIGFLGAGTILKLSGERQIRGLTTAAGIWLAAAVGVAVGLGRLIPAVLGTLLALIILSVLRQLEQRITTKRGGKNDPGPVAGPEQPK
jgi:putative Mg2+ transporter-C (MgtC) family protein